MAIAFPILDFDGDYLPGLIQLRRNEQRQILLGHVHDVSVLRRHPRVGVAEKVLHGLQIASVK